jgi:lactate dehydrogenase-like 2-hydroxyacid dehydrogenase
MNLLFCGSGWPDIVDLIAARLEPGDRVHRWDRTRSLVDEIAAQAPEVILPSNGHVDASAIAAAAERGLRLIQQPAAGTDAIDKAAAAARGIPVCNAPGANQTAVAECTLLLLLLARALRIQMETDNPRSGSMSPTPTRPTPVHSLA